jgi:hypothetical protein
VLRALALLALIPTVAHAQLGAPPEDTEEVKIFKEMMFGDIKHELDLDVHGSVGAEAGRETRALASVGGEIAWDVGRCRALFAGGEANVQGDVGSSSIWGGFCFPSPFNRMELTIRGDQSLEPGLGSLPIAMRSRYAGFGVEIKNTFIGYKEHEIIPMTFALGTFDQPGIDTGYANFAISAYRRNRADGRQLEILPFGMRAAGNAIAAVGGGIYLAPTAYEVSPLRIARTSAGELLGYAVEADLVAGLAYATIANPPDSRMGPSTVVFKDYDLFTDMTIRATRDESTFAIHLRRAFEPTYTEELLLDTRAEASWTYATKTRTLFAGTFLSLIRRMDRSGPVDSTPFGGVRAAFVQKLPYLVELQLNAEAARSFYASLDETAAYDAQWSARATANLAFRFARGTP